MNQIKNIYLGVGLFIVIVFIFNYPKIKESQIKKELNNANYCDEDNDCVNITNKCPFGCYNYINVNEIVKIDKMIKSYFSIPVFLRQECVYGCVSCSNVKCESKKCVPICE